MPHNPSLEPKQKAFRVLFGQKPLTKFKDYKSSIKVELIKYDDREQMLRGTYDFVKATWSEDGKESERATEEQMKDALNQMLSGKALGLGLETVNMMFRISGITRIDTHQIVRQRIGVTFSQQCTGDRFLTHNDAMVEEAVAKDPDNLKAYMDATLAAKEAYALMNDNGVSIQAARAILPHNLETFIFMNTNLMTLLFFFQKRIDDGSQTWQINEIARQMAAEVVKVYPELEAVFEKHKTKFKFQKEASADRKNMFSTGLYIPKEDEFDYHENDFLYPMKKEEMHFTGNPIEPRYFWGKQEVVEDEYNYIKDKYEKFEKDTKSKGIGSIEEIKAAGHKLNEEIYDDLGGNKGRFAKEFREESESSS